MGLRARHPPLTPFQVRGAAQVSRGEPFWNGGMATRSGRGAFRSHRVVSSEVEASDAVAAGSRIARSRASHGLRADPDTGPVKRPKLLLDAGRRVKADRINASSAIRHCERW